MFKKIIQNTVIYSLAPYVANFANLLILPIITKDLTPFDYGISGTIYAYTGALGALSNLGLTIILTNSFFQHPDHFKWIWRQIYGFLALWNIVFGLIVAFILFVFIPESVKENRAQIILLNTLPLIFFGPTNAITTLYYILKKQASQIGIRTAVFGSMAVFLNWYFISRLKLGYMGWFWTTFIVGLMTNISYWYALNRVLKITPIFNFKRSTIKRSLGVSIPIIPSHYSYYLLDGSDRLIMDQLKVPTGNIGEYNIAASFGNYVGSLTSASNNAIVPFLMSMYKRNEHKRAKLIIYGWLLSILSITFSICLWAKELFEILVKNDILKQSYPLAIIMIMAYNFRPVFIGAYQYMVFREKTKTIWLVSFFAGLISVGSNLIFIPLFGFKAAIFSLYFSFFYWGVGLYFTRSYRLIRKENYRPIGLSMVIVVITFLVFLLKDISQASKLIISVMSLSGFLFLLVHIFKLTRIEANSDSLRSV